MMGAFLLSFQLPVLRILPRAVREKLVVLYYTLSILFFLFVVF